MQCIFVLKYMGLHRNAYLTKCKSMKSLSTSHGSIVSCTHSERVWKTFYTFSSAIYMALSRFWLSTYHLYSIHLHFTCLFNFPNIEKGTQCQMSSICTGKAVGYILALTIMQTSIVTDKQMKVIEWKVLYFNSLFIIIFFHP